MKIWNKILLGLTFSVLSSTASASVLPLEGRLPTTLGGTNYQAYYDPNLDITWAAETRDLYGTYGEALAWIGSYSLGGVDGWRLPDMDINRDGLVVNCSGGGITGCNDNEFGFLYAEEGVSSFNRDPFQLAPNDFYWSVSKRDVFNINQWVFRFDGAQIELPINSINYAWAVHDGDVFPSAIPIPAAAWLFGTALIGLIGFIKRRNTV